MRSIKQLIQDLNTKENQRLFDAFKTTDDNVTELLNRIDALEKKNMKYFCRVVRETNQAIPTGVSTSINFTSTEYPQFGNMHDNTVDNDKVWIRRNGVYHLSVGIQWGGVAGGTARQLVIFIGRGGVLIPVCYQREGPIGAAVNAQNAGCSWYCYKGDYVILQVLQDTGGPVDIVANGPISPFLAVTERMEDLNPSEYGLLDPNANMR